MAGKTLAVYAINQHRGKDYRTRVGAAFENGDGSLNLVLNCVPLNGKLQVREAAEKRGRVNQPPFETLAISRNFAYTGVLIALAALRRSGF